MVTVLTLKQSAFFRSYRLRDKSIPVGAPLKRGYSSRFSENRRLTALLGHLVALRGTVRSVSCRRQRSHDLKHSFYRVHSKASVMFLFGASVLEA